VVEIKAADRGMPEAKAVFAEMKVSYPHMTRQPVFCWLWDNYEQVSELRNWKGMRIARVGWDELAAIGSRRGDGFPRPAAEWELRQTCLGARVEDKARLAALGDASAPAPP
jgi:hypothetical protein